MLFHSQEKERGGAGETGEHMQQNWEFLGHTDLKFKPPDTNVAGHVVHARWPNLVGTVNGGAKGPRAAGPPECHLPASRQGFPPKMRKIQPELARGKQDLGVVWAALLPGEGWSREIKCFLVQTLASVHWDGGAHPAHFWEMFPPLHVSKQCPHRVLKSHVLGQSEMLEKEWKSPR